MYLLEDDITKLKTKVHYTCEKYSDAKIPHKYPRTTDTFRRNNNTVMLEQGKGRGVVLLDKKIYIKKSGALRHLVPFVRFKKREKHPWRSVCFLHHKVCLYWTLISL